MNEKASMICCSGKQRHSAKRLCGGCLATQIPARKNLQTRQADVPLPEGVIPVTQLSGRRWKGIVMMKKTLVLLAVATILTSVPGDFPKTAVLTARLVDRTEC